MRRAQAASWLTGPSLVDKTFMLFVVAAPLALSARLLDTDGDLGRHLRMGALILHRGSLVFHDPFSYTRPGAPLVPYEWLSEVLFALAHRAAGLAGVAVFSAVIFAASVALVVRFLLRRRVEPFLAYSVGLAAAALASAHLLARPHLFTMLGAVLLLERLDTDTPRPLWPVALLFLLWANLHGGFLFGLLLIAAYVAGDALELVAARAAMRRDEKGAAGDAAEWRRQLASHGAMLGVAAAAACINPAGPRLYAHVVGYLGDTYLVGITTEYVSVNFHTMLGRLFLLALLALVVALACAPRRPTYPRLLLLLGVLACALHSQRNVPLFGLTALPVAALHLDPTLRARRVPGLVRMRATFLAEGTSPAVGVWSAVAVAIMAALALHGGRIGRWQAVADGFSPERFPVAAVARARAARLDGRIFSEFTWGGYLLYAWPEQRVFIDGQTDFYGDSLTRDYVRIASLAPGWRQRLAAWDVSIAILPAGTALAAALAREPGWSSWHDDATAVVLVRRRISRSSTEATGAYSRNIAAAPGTRLK